MNDAYLTCQKCNAEIGSSATSVSHARTINIPWFTESFAWCYNCSWVTFYKKSRFRRWLVHKGIHIGGGFHPVLVMDLDDVVKLHYKFYSGQDNYGELIWLISRCFVECYGQ